MLVIKLFKIIFKRTLCFIFLFATYFAAWAQSGGKRMLTPKDYGLWSFLVPDQLSDNGNWASYRLLYKYTNSDTLVLKNTKGNQQYIFPHAVKGKFNEEFDFACIAKDTLIVQNLKTGKHYKRGGVNDFAFSANQKFLAILIKQSNGTRSLEIRDRLNNVLQTTENITFYRFNPSLDGVVYSIAGSEGNKVEMMLFKDVVIKKTIAENQDASFQRLVWNGNSIAFIKNVVADPVLFSYDVRKNLLKVLNPENVNGYPSGMKVSDVSYRIPIISDDGLRIFFWLKEPQLDVDANENSAVQIWNSKDKLLYDFKKSQPYYKWSDKLAVWDLNNNRVLQITDMELPVGYLSASYSTAFIYDPTTYEPQTKQTRPYDLYAIDLKTGDRSLIVKEYVFDRQSQGSPDGKYLCYAKQGHWWVYDIQKKTSKSLTYGIPFSFFSEDSDVPGEDRTYGIGGWTNNGEIILYDRYDLWKLSLDGEVKIRLTKGRETEKTYRVQTFDDVTLPGDTQTKKYLLNLNDGLLLTEVNKQTGEEGLSYWDLKKDLKELVWGNKKITQIKKARNGNIYTYVDQNFKSAPRLMFYDGSAKEIVKTNTQQELFYWGKNERIQYTVDGRKTKGVLFYPATYNPNLTYPMVVQIYERKFAELNLYENPTLHSADGFNVTHFTAQGYFVLYPDINYEFGNLKKSVTNSVLAAVDTALRKGNIDRNKVGLVGHSFGGYETNLIITQTDRFAAAVAGAAVTDLVSSYLYVGPLFRRPDFFRTENHQFRIGKSLYEDMPAYLNNSPVLLADKVKTPLLGWTGEEDRHVNYLQSMEFYLALRRADKEHTLLVYSGEEHQIDKKENAADLSIRIMQWFDYYLKDGKKQVWMNSDYKR